MIERKIASDTCRTLNPISIISAFRVENSFEVIDMPRMKISGRNEKYYDTLLSAWKHLNYEICKVEATADAIIKSYDIARPT